MARREVPLQEPFVKILFKSKYPLRPQVMPDAEVVAEETEEADNSETHAMSSPQRIA
jgi:hypothetical protein